jgi:phage shock protein A
MGVFTRFRDIISANINSMLDRAEDPEKMIKLMIREMEDTLVEIKSSCAGVMAECKKIERGLEDVRSKEMYWEEKAKLAVQKGRDDLAREALHEKKRFSQRVKILEDELAEHNTLVNQYKDDIRQLEDKLASACEKQRVLVHRHVRAQRKMRAQEEIRKASGSEAIIRFDELENRIERMEAEADLVNVGHRANLEAELDKLTLDDDIEKELKAMKSAESHGSNESNEKTDRVQG